MYGVITYVATTYLLNPSEANAAGKTDFLWGGISIFSFLWCYYRLPETKNHTYEELDCLFEKHVSARKFESYVINEEELEHDLEVVGNFFLVVRILRYSFIVTFLHQYIE